MATPSRSRTTRKPSGSGTRSRTSGNTTSANKTPTVESLQNQICGNCSVGVLRILRYDPKALHEVGQDLTAENQHASGGAYETECGFCGQRMSHPLGDSSAESGEGA